MIVAQIGDVRQQDLIGTFEFTVLDLEILDAFGIISGARTSPGIGVGLFAPPAQRVSIHADTTAEPDHRLVQRQLRILLLGFTNKPYRTLSDTERVVRQWLARIQRSTRPVLVSGCSSDFC